MKTRIIALVQFILLFSCFTSGCSDSLLDPKKPVNLTFWHVYGAQTDGPMNALVERFNKTVGREKGITISVTSVSNTIDVHFALVAAAQKHPGASALPDMFIAYPKTILAIGRERFMDWKDQLPEEKLRKYIPSFIEEGEIDGRLLALPIAKSSNLMFINATIFDEFARETGVGYGDLATWEGFFRAAKRYHEWSRGKAFFKYDYWLQYSIANTVSLGGKFFKDGKIDFSDARFEKVWRKLAESALGGEVCLLGGYSTTAMMTGEIVCGIESTAAILYFKDTVTFPDNTTMPLRLKILPPPSFEGGKALEIQRGGGLCVVKSTRQKEYAASIFAQWLTDERINVPFVTATGYLPVKQAAYQTLMEEGATPFINDTYKELYAIVSKMQATHTFYIIPPFADYGETEKAFTEAQVEIFGIYGKDANKGGASSQELTRKMFDELKRAMQ